jgi:hypothetical protein
MSLDESRVRMSEAEKKIITAEVAEDERQI